MALLPAFNLLMALAVSGGPVHEHDRLRYALGGVMSGPVDLDLDLTTGAFTLQEPLRSSAGSPATHRSQGRLRPVQLARIRKQAASASARGFETVACRRAEAKGAIMMPIMDALPSLTVRLAHRSSSAPVRVTCWSEAANALVGVALDAAHGAAG